MKIQFSMKDPDGVPDSFEIESEVKHIYQSLSPGEVEMRAEKILENIQEWLHWGEVIELVYDTNTDTLSIVKPE